MANLSEETVGRRSERIRKVSEKMAVVDSDYRQHAVLAHLEELENDFTDLKAEGSDEDFDFEDEESPRKKKLDQKGVRKRTTRSMIDQKHGNKSFNTLLQEARLDLLPEEAPSYLKATADPPRIKAPRKFCSICGNVAPYTCVRCGMRFCSRSCHSIHADTRCLKFMT